MSTGNCDDITHPLNNSHNGIARSFPESLINFEDRPSWPTALLPSSCLIYLKTVSSDMHLTSNSVVGGILALINRIPSCELCISIASRKYQIIDAIWYTIIVSNRGKILVKYIGNTLWLRKYTIILFDNYLVSTTVENLLGKKWLYNFETFLVTILLVTSLSKICLNWSLV